jgi:hypothetical protein
MPQVSLEMQVTPDSFFGWLHVPPPALRHGVDNLKRQTGDWPPYEPVSGWEMVAALLARCRPVDLLVIRAPGLPQIFATKDMKHLC